MLFTYDGNKDNIDRYVRMFIRRTSPHLYHQMEDLVQEAVVAFILCQNDYDSKRPWKPWLKRSIHNRLNDYIKSDVRFHKLKQEISENPMGYEEVVEMDVSYEQSDSVNVSRHRGPEEEAVFADTVGSLMGSCDAITTSEVVIMNSYLTNSGSCEKAGVDLGMDRVTVWRNIQRVVKKLKTHTNQ